MFALDPHTMMVTSGLRVGFWNDTFECIGVYQGPELGFHQPGTELKQDLAEGEVRFKIGVLFNNELHESQKRETILILIDYVPEMFDYNDWQTA
tara:strand:+ start:1692 stop:1973 length:282 start_codon:yes stop_codon:yes gene_type:complete